MEKIKIRGKYLSRKALMPHQSNRDDLGFTLFASEPILNPKRLTVNYHTGIGVDIPEGYIGMLIPTETALNTGMILLSNIVRTGEEIVVIYEIKPLITPMRSGDPIAKLIIVPSVPYEWEFED